MVFGKLPSLLLELDKEEKLQHPPAFYMFLNDSIIRFQQVLDPTSALDFCEWFRKYIGEEFGRLAHQVLKNWKIENFSQIYFALTRLSAKHVIVLSKSDTLERFEKYGNILE